MGLSCNGFDVFNEAKTKSGPRLGTSIDVAH